MKKLFAGMILTFLSNQVLAYNIDAYLEELNKHSVTTIDQAVALLPSTIKSRFTLMHQGHGLRGTSYLEPAAILFDPDGSFFVNIGSPNQAFGDEIEILQFNQEARKIELFALKFPLERSSSGRIIRPETNPQKCLSCHGTDPKVLWGDYNLWHGAYQALSDKDEMKGSELDYFRAFRKEGSHKTPYKNLIFNPENEFSPYLSEELSKTSPDPYFVLEMRPNTHISFLAAQINSTIYGRQIEQSPNFQKRHAYWYLHNSYRYRCSDFGIQIHQDNRALLRSLGIDIEERALYIGNGYNSVSYFLNYQFFRILNEKFQDTRLTKDYIAYGIASEMGNYPVPKDIHAIDKIGLNIKAKSLLEPHERLLRCKLIAREIGI